MGDGGAIIYNLHLDAGGSSDDFKARAIQVSQLLEHLRRHGAGRALIVAGDTNLKMAAEVDDPGLLGRLLDETGLQDACRALRCDDARIDRVLLRSSATVELGALDRVIDPSFVLTLSEDLSDHLAVGVIIG